MDVGDQVGALVVTTDATLDEHEIEICPAGSGERTHTVVRARDLPAGSIVYAGVFPSLAAGEYRLLARGAHPEISARVIGGEITQIDW